MVGIGSCFLHEKRCSSEKRDKYRNKDLSLSKIQGTRGSTRAITTLSYRSLYGGAILTLGKEEHTNKYS